MDINGIYVEWYWFALIIGCIGILIGSGIGYYAGAKDYDEDMASEFKRGYRAAINDNNMTPNTIARQVQETREMMVENERQIKRAKGMAAYAYFMGK